MQSINDFSFQINVGLLFVGGSQNSKLEVHLVDRNRLAPGDEQDELVDECSLRAQTKNIRGNQEDQQSGFNYDWVYPSLVYHKLISFFPGKVHENRGEK